MKKLLMEMEASLDRKNLLDVAYAVSTFHANLQTRLMAATDCAKDEYALLLFHTNDLLDLLKKHPEEKEDVFLSIHSMLVSCVEMEAMINEKSTWKQ